MQAWADDPAISLKASTNEGVFHVEVGPAARLGPHLVRLYNSEGASKPRIFLVGKAPESDEKESNDGITTAQKLDRLPITLNGRFDKGGDIDTFKVSLKAGVTLVARLDSYALGSPVDPLIHLVDAQGVRIAFAHDQSTLDPLLAFPIPKAGDYYLQVAAFGHPPEANVQFTGSSASVYRLTVTDGPYARFAFPAGRSKASDLPIEVAAWNSAPRKLGEGEIAGLFLNELSLDSSCLPEMVEHEPNDGTNSAFVVSSPCVMNGRIEKPGDIDEFVIHPKKGDRLVFSLKSASLGFLMDGRLRLRDAAGAELAQNDDAARAADPKIEWTAPGEGPYFLQVSDIFHKGGEDYIYRLEIRPRRPTFSLAADKDAVVLAPGGTAEIKVTVRRHEGFEGKITLSALGLPEGVTIENRETPEKGSDFVLKLVADPNTKVFNGSFSILGKQGEAQAPVLFDIGANDTGGPFLVDETEALWITVKK